MQVRTVIWADVSSAAPGLRAGPRVVRAAVAVAELCRSLIAAAWFTAEGTSMSRYLLTVF